MPARLARLKDAASAPGRFVVSSDGRSYPTRFTRRESRAGLPNTYRPTEALQGEVRVLNDGRMPRRARPVSGLRAIRDMHALCRPTFHVKHRDTSTVW